MAVDGATWLDWVRNRRVRGVGEHYLMIGIAVVAYGVDTATKQLAIALLAPPKSIPLLGGWFQLQLLYNSGAAFSMGARFTPVIASVGVVALILILTLIAPRVAGRLENVIVGLLLAGVAGNVTDRMVRAPGPFRGHVVDFIGLRYFAVFNVADICITAAAVILVIAVLRSQVGQKSRP